MVVYDVGGVSFFVLISAEIAVDGKKKKLRGCYAVKIMTLQIYSDYNIPIPPRELDFMTMRYFYDPLVPGLVKLQKRADKE